MPSFKMKIKSTTGCSKEKNGLHVCRKSSTISKNPPSVTRVAQNVEETRSCALRSLDAVSHYDKVHDHDLGGNEDDHDPSLKEAKVTQKHQSVTNSATCICIEPTASTCESNIEVTFSSTADSVDLHNNEGGENFCVPNLDSEDSDDIIRSSTEYAACILSDLFMSDMIFSGPPTQGNLLLSNNMTDTSVLPDCKWEDSNLFCDLAEEYMLLPFLEDSLDAGCDREDRPSEEAIIHVDNSSLYMAIHQLRSPNHDCDIDTFLDPHYEWFDSQMYISNHFDQPGTTFSLLPSSVSNEKQNNKQITLVLDLDETLVHSTLDCCDDADFTFTVFFNMKEHIVYVKQRPHLQTFLKRVAEMFEIVVFTASESIYAKQLIDILDPDGKLISRRAYRDSCIFSEGIYMKDLTVLGVDLAKVAIVDNSPQVFRLQVNNGIPIKSWFDDPSDCELLSLLPFLETLVNADDVRPIISRKFDNK